MARVVEKLLKLETQINVASSNMKTALLEWHPVGSLIQVLLNHRQNNPSPAEVMSVNGNEGTYRVRLINAENPGRPTVKNIPWRNVRT